MDITLQIILSLITAGSSGFVGFLLFRLRKYYSNKERNLNELLQLDEAIIEALRALCRDRILQGYRYYKQHGEITTQDLETMSRLYKAYHALGGNGTITAVFEKILRFPIKSGV